MTFIIYFFNLTLASLISSMVSICLSSLQTSLIRVSVSSPANTDMFYDSLLHCSLFLRFFPFTYERGKFFCNINSMICSFFLWSKMNYDISLNNQYLHISYIFNFIRMKEERIVTDVYKMIYNITHLVYFHTSQI